MTITADVAREISIENSLGKLFKLRLYTTCNKIENAAKNGHREILLKDHFWASGGIYHNEEYEEAVEKLK